MTVRLKPVSSWNWTLEPDLISEKFVAVPVALKTVPTFSVAVAKPTDRYAPPSAGAVLILMFVAEIVTTPPKTSETVPAVMVVLPKLVGSSATVMVKLVAVAVNALPTFKVALATATVSVPDAVTDVLAPAKITPKSVKVTEGFTNVRIEPRATEPV